MVGVTAKEGEDVGEADATDVTEGTTEGLAVTVGDAV